MCDMAMDLWPTKLNNRYSTELPQLYHKRFLKWVKTRMRNLFYAQNSVVYLIIIILRISKNKQSLPYLNLL